MQRPPTHTWLESSPRDASIAATSASRSLRTRPELHGARAARGSWLAAARAAPGGHSANEGHRAGGDAPAPLTRRPHGRIESAKAACGVWTLLCP